MFWPLWIGKRVGIWLLRFPGCRGRVPAKRLRSFVCCPGQGILVALKGGKHEWAGEGRGSPMGTRSGRCRVQAAGNE